MPGPYWSIRLTTRAWKNQLYRLPPKKDFHVYLARSTYHYAYIRTTNASQLDKKKQINWKKETKKRKDKGNERKRQESEKTKKEWKEKKRQEKQETTRQEEEARKGQKKKNVILLIAEPLELTKDGIGLIERCNVTTTQLPPCCLRGWPSPSVGDRSLRSPSVVIFRTHRPPQQPGLLRAADVW